MSAPTGAPALPSPGEGLSLAGFPRATLAKGTRVYRCHRSGRAHWWFASRDPAGPGGRFDLASPRGTHYVASDLETAVRERLRDRASGAGHVPQPFAASFAVTVTTVAKDWSCAHVDARGAARFGVTREMATLPPAQYGVTQAWAERFAATGHDGIRYGARFTPGRSNAWALFGQAGDAERPVPAVVETVSGPDACRRIGLAVLTTPYRESVRVIPG